MQELTAQIRKVGFCSCLLEISLKKEPKMKDLAIYHVYTAPGFDNKQVLLP